MEKDLQTKFAEESLPNYTEIKVLREKIGRDKNEDRGCLFFYDPPTVEDLIEEACEISFDNQNNLDDKMLGRKPVEIAIQKPVQQNMAFGDVEDLGEKYQISIDVAGYAPGDISVKTVGHGELMVEGKRTQTTGVGAGVTSCFSKRVQLPGKVELDGVSSSLSPRGVLTVTAPKVKTSPGTSRFSNQVSRPAPHDTHSNFMNTANRTTSSKDTYSDMMSDLDLETRMNRQLGFDDDMSSKMCMPIINGVGTSQEMVEEDTCFKITLSTKGYQPSDISLKTTGEKDLIIEGKHVEDNGDGTKSQKNFSRKFTLSQAVNQDTITSSLSRDGTLTITAPKVKADKNSTSQIRHSPNNSTRTTQSSEQKFSSNNRNENPSSPFRTDTTMDKFFDPNFDNVFQPRKINTHTENSRNEMNNNSFKSMMNNDWMTEQRVPDFFANNPETKMTPTSMTMGDMVETETGYTVKINVDTYEPKDIRVRSVSDRDLLIEGSHQIQGATRSFSQKIGLPRNANIEAVSSSLSKDGVLTITAPKIQEAKHVQFHV